MDKYVSVLDLGTNNCRCYIARITPDGQTDIVESYSDIVKLGDGLAITGYVNERAQNRTLHALKKFKRVHDLYPVFRNNMHCYPSFT